MLPYARRPQLARSAPRLLVALALLLATGAAGAQDSVVVASGDRVRAFVVPPGVWRTGTLAHLAGDSLRLRPAQCPTCAPDVLPRAAITRLEASAGRPGHPFRGMALGLLAGAAIGAFVVAPCPHGNVGSDGPPCGLAQGAATVAGGLGGLLVGGVAGAFWPSRERWRPARWP
jgi:hypothetical protein